MNDLPLQTPESSSGFDIEADRLRALMRASVFKQKFQPVTVDRFEIVRLLGSGAMGIVYEAIDPRDGEHVALKTLRNHNPRALSLFKKEFRALSQLSHPNLVTLYELGREHKKYFFTMELVRGIALQKYLWGLDVDDHNPESSSQSGLSASGSIIGLTASPVTDFVRLRDVFGQLAAGLLALHHAGKLHRDIKPTNVLVTPRGRVVLMDFGFVSEQGLGALESTHSNVVVGTPAFMAPEQAQAATPSPASDWYSFGATLYMVLTGTPPFSGLRLPEMLHAKQNTRPPSPRRMVRGVPADLDELCTALLDPDPSNRPSEQHIVETLLGKGASVRPAAVRGAVAHPASGKRNDFIGRKTELEQLMAALAKTQTGQSQAVEICGRAGMGKTALVRKFTQTVADAGKAIILKTRCYERDSLEFKVIDGLVDAVIRNLRQRDKEEVQALLPPDSEALVQVFPALLQVRAFKPVPEERGDRKQLRKRALVALKALLGSLATVPVVLWIDDLHWSDHASFEGLLTLLCGDGPRLLVVSYRENPRHLPLSEFLRKLESCVCGHETMALGALLPGDAVELSERLLARHSPDQASPELSQTIASESLGNPLYIHEMVRFFARPQPPGEPARPALTLAGLLHIRVAQLPEDTRYLMEIIAVAGRPITLTHTLAAAGLDGDVRPALQHLVNAELLTLRDLDDDQELACSDDRARSSVLAGLDGHALRGFHERLAHTYEQAGDADPELLAFHYRAAREFELANRYTVAAADLAWARHDFNEAARHYATAVELNTLDPEVSHGLRLKLARALQAAGRDYDAASVLLKTAENHASGRPEPEQLIDAGFGLLLTGNVDRGQKILLDAGEQINVRPSVPGWRLGQWARRGALRLRGLRFTPKTEGFVPFACTRVDLMWAATFARLLLAPETARAGQIRLLRESLSLGEPSRVARAIACEAWIDGLQGTRSNARVDELIAYACEILHQVENPTVRGLVALAETRAQLARGAWPQTLRRAKSARTRMYHEDPTCGRILWELDWLAAQATQKMGRAEPAPAPWSMQMQQASAAHDYRAYAAYGALASWQALSEGNLTAANAALTAAVARCPAAPTIRIRLAFVETQMRLYEGELARAREVIEATTRSFHGLVSVDQQLRIELGCLQATSLAHGILAGDPRTSRASIMRSIARLVSEDFPGATGTAELLRGCLDLFDGAADSARTQFERAQKYFADASMARHAAIAGLRAAEVGGDEPGVRSLRYELTELGVFATAIDRLAHMFCPRVSS